MLAGYESTSYALLYCFYVLATNKNEQDRLYDEIMNFKYNNNDDSNLNEMKYLDMFCKEILRFYPISRVVRRCVKETTIKNICMSQGLIVKIDVKSVHFDPQIWGSNSNVFDSTRFI